MSIAWTLWDLAREVGGSYAEVAETACDRVLELIDPPLASGQLRCVDLLPDGTLSAWTGDPRGHAERIREEWTRIARPRVGDICALVTPDSPTADLAPGAGALNAVDSAAVQWGRLDDLRESEDDSPMAVLASEVAFALLPKTDETVLRNETLRLLAPLLRSGQIVPITFPAEPADPLPGGPVAQPWEGTPEDYVARLEAAWPEGKDIDDLQAGYFAYSIAGAP